VIEMQLKARSRVEQEGYGKVLLLLLLLALPMELSLIRWLDRETVDLDVTIRVVLYAWLRA
jgi:hypothetical protein